MVFFGAPHAGSKFAYYGLRLAKLTAWLTGRTANWKIIQGLKPNSAVLQDLQDYFNRLAAEQSVQVYTFFEAKGFTGVIGASGKVQ